MIFGLFGGEKLAASAHPTDADGDGYADNPSKHVVKVNGMEYTVGDKAHIKAFDNAVSLQTMNDGNINGYKLSTPHGQHEAARIKFMLNGMEPAKAQAEADKIWGHKPVKMQAPPAPTPASV